MARHPKIWKMHFGPIAQLCLFNMQYSITCFFKLRLCFFVLISSQFSGFTFTEAWHMSEILSTTGPWPELEDAHGFSWEEIRLKPLMGCFVS